MKRLNLTILLKISILINLIMTHPSRIRCTNTRIEAIFLICEILCKFKNNGVYFLFYIFISLSDVSFKYDT